MLKRIFILIFFYLMISAASASNITIAGESAYIKKVTVMQVVSDTTGIKDELAHENLKEILAGVMKIKEGKIGEIINKFQSHIPSWVWIIREGVLAENVNGETQLTSDGILTLLDYARLKNATNLSIARTIIHEMIHAYLTLDYNLTPLEAKRDYPEIYAEWQTNNDFDYDQAQHKEIEKRFLDDIAAALKEFGDNTKLNVNDAIYADLAWGGLDVQNNTRLTAAAKKRIQSRLAAEQSNRASGKENPVGTSITN